MYVLIDLATNEKVREATQPTRGIGLGQTWLPIRYDDPPEHDGSTKTTVRTEGREGAEWVKSWTLRDLTRGEIEKLEVQRGRKRSGEIMRVAALKLARERAIQDGYKASDLPPDEDYPR